MSQRYCITLMCVRLCACVCGGGIFFVQTGWCVKLLSVFTGTFSRNASPDSGNVSDVMLYSWWELRWAGRNTSRVPTTQAKGKKTILCDATGLEASIGHSSKAAERVAERGRTRLFPPPAPQSISAADEAFTVNPFLLWWTCKSLCLCLPLTHT